MESCVGRPARRELRLPDAPAASALLGELHALRSRVGPRRIEGPFALYGAGKLGRMAMEFFDHARLTPAVVVDANAEMLRDDPAWQSREILAPNQVSADMKRALPLVVSIATVCFTEMAETLRSQGWQEVVPLYDVMEAYRDRYPIGNGWFMGDVNAAERANIEQVMAGWSDDMSRAAHVQFLAWHRLRQDWVFEKAPVDLAGRYFIPEVLSVLGEQETFVDVGAHRGETAIAFRELVNNRFSEVVMFEPDPRNAEVISTWLYGLPETVRKRHRLITRAVSNGRGKRPFFSRLGYGSQLCGFGGDSVDVTVLDDMSVAPSYLKLHLEGHEWEALQGAERTILRHRPLIAATIYHNEAGMWRLPSWLMNKCRNYRYYLRLHSWCGTGAVMYGIPTERRRVSLASRTDARRKTAS